VDTALRKNDSAAARRLLDDAGAGAKAMRPIDRAHLDLRRAGLAGDATATRRALQAWAAADPADPAPPAALAAIAERDHDYPRTVALLRIATSLNPDDASLANHLGYAEAWAGNMEAALSAMGRYAAMRPRDANPLDSTGDVYFHYSRFKDAERSYLAAFEKDPQFNGGGAAYKAAFARLVTGDVSGASKHFDRFLAARPADPLADYRRADWLWLTGRRQEAVRALETFAARHETGAARDLAAGVLSHLGIWKLELGDAAAARAHAERAAAMASPANTGLPAAVRFLAEPPAAASEWKARAERAFAFPAGTEVKQLALAAALLRSGEFAEATPVMRDLYSRWLPSTGDPVVPVLLAWALAGSGRHAEAAPLLAHLPAPRAGSLSPFTALWFPRVFELRAKVSEKQGNAAEARAGGAVWRALR
jgi:tetratricopeptide (TPR) repeat protein